MAKASKHYLKSGKEYTGATHKMPDGTLHTGAKHTPASKPLKHTKPKKKGGATMPKTARMSGYGGKSSKVKKGTKKGTKRK